ncbi:hypothetical protein ABLG96_00190 [Nakamurella sp. A5-74]|uniref:Uncharacterized protein n=1 Tax=Nakamurella sp. A5-74 TaxID=3158264 RepID=A0AAU8DR48_9ACTN
MKPMEPAQAFPEALGGELEPGVDPDGVDSGVDPDGVDPVAEDGGGVTEEASAVLPTVGVVLVPPPTELPPAEFPPAQPVTDIVRQAMAAIPLTNWERRMGHDLALDGLLGCQRSCHQDRAV